MNKIGKVGFSGHLATRHIKGPNNLSIAWDYKIRNSPNLWRGWWRWQVAKLFGTPAFHGELRARLFKADGRVIDYGLISTRVITTAFVNFLVDQLQTESSVIGDFKFHDSGVGTTAENVTDTGIETTDGESRATGTQVEGASANIYKSVGTISYSTTKAITEHGLFNDASAGTLLDRSVFAAINVVSGDAVEFTYQLTCSAGS